jgi:hypothetical protein
MIPSPLRSQVWKPQFIPVIIIICETHPLNVVVTLQIKGPESIIMLHVILMIHLKGTLCLFSGYTLHYQWVTVILLMNSLHLNATLATNEGHLSLFHDSILFLTR